MRAVRAGALLVGLLAAPAVAHAQPAVFEADLEPDRFVLTSDPDSIALTESAAPLAARAMAIGLALRLGGAPLTVCVGEDPDTCEVEGDVVGDRVGADLTYALGLGRFGLHAQLPLVLNQGTDFEPAMGEAELASAGIGDLRVGGKAWLVRGGGATLGADIAFSLPTGTGDFIGDGGTVIEPRALVDWRGGQVAVAASLGYALRTEPATVADLHVDDELLWSLGGEYAVVADQLSVGAAVFGRVGIASHPDPMADGTSDGAPAEPERLAEALFSGRYRLSESLALEAAAGTALDAGYGAPAYRVLAGVRWTRPAPAPAPPPPLPPEPEPEPEPEPPPPEPEPVADTDQDGLLDDVDACVTEPEDLDGFQDTDGCPDPDNDGDGFLDPDDKCPDVAEIMNGYEDDDGCADDPPKLVIETSSVDIDQTIYFDLNKARIKTRSHKLLNAVVKLLKANPELRVRVEGHTDDTGTPEWNQELSEKRAEAVRQYLIKKGIAEDRLESAGYGTSRPVVEGTSERARKKNRRVEFVIIQ